MEWGWGVTEEAPKVTDPTPHTQQPSRMRAGLTKCEEGEKGCRVWEIQALAHIFAYRKEKGRAGLPAQKGWNYTFTFSTSLCRRKQMSLLPTVLH